MKYGAFDAGTLTIFHDTVPWPNSVLSVRVPQTLTPVFTEAPPPHPSTTDFDSALTVPPGTSLWKCSRCHQVGVNV